MAPTQPLMEFEADRIPQLNVELVTEKEIKSLVANSDTKGLTRGNNFEDTISEIKDRIDEKNKAPEDSDIDVTECKNSSDIRSLVETEDPNATEYSSSFDDTVDDAEIFSGFSEGEVESQFFGDNGFGSAFDAFDTVFRMRKKKLTNHWRNYIRPVMWRCKWMELRMKDIDRKVLKYARELEAYDRGNHLEFEQFNSEEFCSKSSPFQNRRAKGKAMKRRRRKRVEDTVDVANYMSQHNLFSYLENKRSDLDNASLADEFGNAVTTEQIGDCNVKLGSDEWTPFETRERDVSVEQVLFRIETLHSWVKKLKGQIETVISKNAAKFSSSENLSLLAPLDVQTSSAHSPAFSTGNGDTALSPGAMYASARHLTDYDIGDLVLPESVVSSFGEAITVPDIIESTVGLLSAADVTLHQPQFGDSNEDIVENVLMHEEIAEGERQSFHQPFENYHPKQEPDVWGQEDVKPCLIIPSSSQEPVMNNNNALVPHEQQSTLESCLASDVNFPRNKRKRGERKAGSLVWNKRCSGETDSQ